MKGRLVFLKSPREIEIREYPLPDPERGAVLTEVIRSNICGSDIHCWSGNNSVVQGDVALGHETVGRIAKLGPGVETDYAGQPVKEGDRIVAAYFLTCMKCPACLRGQFNMCHNVYKNFLKHPDVAPHFHGALSTNVYIHPNQYFYKVPDNVNNEVASGVNCAMSQVYFSMEQAGLTNGEFFLIQGAGGLGLNAVAIAKEKGATVIVIDGVEERLKLAEEFGATYTINLNEFKTVEERESRVKELTGGEGADVAMEVVGKGSAFGEGLLYLRLGGRYLEVGNVSLTQTITFSPAMILRKGLTVFGVSRYMPWYIHKSLSFLAKFSSKYPYHKFSARVYNLDEVSTALEHSEQRIVARAAIEP